MNYKKWWIIALVFCLVLATLSPLASGSPDGFERVAEDNGFIDSSQSPPYQLIADYILPGIENEILATILAGWLGTLLLFVLAYGITWIITKKKIPFKEAR